MHDEHLYKKISTMLGRELLKYSEKLNNVGQAVIIQKFLEKDPSVAKITHFILTHQLPIRVGYNHLPMLKEQVISHNKKYNL